MAENKLNVVYLVGNLHAGGLERFVTNVCLYAVENNLFVPSIICLAEKTGIYVTRLENSGVTIKQAPQNWNRKKSANAKLAQIIRKLKGNIVHSQVNFSLIQQFQAVRSAGARYYVTERNMYPLKGWSRFKRLIQAKYLSLMGVEYSANSLPVRDHLAKLIFTSPVSIPVIHNGINDSERFPTPFKRAELGIPHNGILIGYVARMAPHKGHMRLIDAIRYLKEKADFEFHVCLVGDGPEMHHLKKKISEVGLSEYFSFLGIRNDIERIYPLFDLQMLLSEHEGMPNVVMEGMAFGIPVLSTSVGNTSELLSDECGILVKNLEEEEIANQMLDLLKDRERRKKISQNAQKRVKQQYTIKSTIEQLIRRYQTSDESN